MSKQTLDRVFERYRKVSKECDHTKHTEKHDNTNMCFCSKLMMVTANNADITLNQFTDSYRIYMQSWWLKQPGFRQSCIDLAKKMGVDI